MRWPGKTVAYFSEIEPNPSTTSVDRCASLARQAGAQTIVGLGGGSSLDVAKVISCLTTNEGSIYDYYAGGAKQFAPRTTRLILIPTTAGTGSEVTNVGVFTDPACRHQNAVCLRAVLGGRGADRSRDDLHAAQGADRLDRHGRFLSRH